MKNKVSPFNKQFFNVISMMIILLINIFVSSDRFFSFTIISWTIILHCTKNLLFEKKLLTFFPFCDSSCYVIGHLTLFSLIKPVVLRQNLHNEKNVERNAQNLKLSTKVRKYAFKAWKDFISYRYVCVRAEYCVVILLQYF